MNIDEKLDLLKKIQREEAPPFLYTRILARIDSEMDQPAPTSWKFAFAAVFTVVLAINASILFKPSPTEPQKGIENMVNAMQLNNTNELYHD